MMTPIFRVSLITFAVLSFIHISSFAPLRLGVSEKRVPDSPADLDLTKQISKDGTNRSSLLHDKNRKSRAPYHLTRSTSKTPINKANNGNMTKPSIVDKLKRSTLESKARHRKRGDVFYQRHQKQLANQLLKTFLDEEVNQTKEKDGVTVDRKLNRSKRWDNGKDYDKEYDWENEGAANDITDQKKDTKWVKWAKNWQKHVLRYIFIFSIITMILGCLCSALGKFCSKMCAFFLDYPKKYRDLCLGRDPTYRNLRQQLAEVGIDLSYEDYLKTKNAYEEALLKSGTKADLSGR